jgi:hypothetical protein
MLPLLALTYTAARLGFEAQSAAAFRLMRMAGGISERATEEIIPEAIVSPIDVAPEPVRVAPKSRHAAKKIHKKSAAVRNAASALKSDGHRA